MGAVLELVLGVEMEAIVGEASSLDLDEIIVDKEWLDEDIVEVADVSVVINFVLNIDNASATIEVVSSFTKDDSNVREEVSSSLGTVVAAVDLDSLVMVGALGSNERVGLELVVIS